MYSLLLTLAVIASPSARGYVEYEDPDTGSKDRRLWVQAGSGDVCGDTAAAYFGFADDYTDPTPNDTNGPRIPQAAIANLGSQARRAKVEPTGDGGTAAVYTIAGTGGNFLLKVDGSGWVLQETRSSGVVKTTILGDIDALIAACDSLTSQIGAVVFDD